MKKKTFIILTLLVSILASCDKITPETANAFKGEYWMETNNIGIVGEQEYPLNERASWTPVTIYEMSGKLYVQTELLGAPDFDNEHPKEIEGSLERPNFISLYRMSQGEEDTINHGIENVEIINHSVLYVVNGFIVLQSNGVRAQTLPIKVKSGSETILHLDPYKPVEVEFTDIAGFSLGKFKAWYEYGPMVKKGETITWDVDYKDTYIRPSGQGENYDRIIHRNVLYKK